MNWKERFQEIEESVKRKEALDFKLAKALSEKVEAIKSFVDSRIDFEEVAKAFIQSSSSIRVKSINKYSFLVSVGNYSISSAVCLKLGKYPRILIDDSKEIYTWSIPLKDVREYNSYIEIRKMNDEREDDYVVFSKDIPLVSATNDKLAKSLVDAYLNHNR
jgi:hypothetical protein